MKMKRVLSYIMTGAVAGLLATGCIDSDYPRGEGYLVFSAEFADDAVAQRFGGETRGAADATRAGALSTRAGADTRAEAPETYTVKIGNDRGYTHVFDSSEVPAKLALVSGDYFIEVFAGEPAAPGWDDELCYHGREDFTITNGGETAVEVEVDVRNTLFTIDFDETVEELMTDYSVTLFPDPDNEATTLVFDADNAGRTANMVLAEGQTEVEWVFEGTHAAEGVISKSGSFTGLEPGKEYEASFKYTYDPGKGWFTLLVTVDDTTVDVGHNITITRKPYAQPVKSAAVWGTHATVSGVAKTGEAIRFGYRPTVPADGEWLFAAGVAGEEEGAWSAVLTGLEPSTAYEFRLEVDGEFSGEAQRLTTEAAPQLPNSNLEEWHQNNVYYPWLQSGTPFWGSGNTRAMGIINVEMTTPVEGRTPGTTAAQLQSKTQVGVFGAGNLFTGSFRLGGTTGTTGFVNFGREFTARPSGLKISYKSTTGTVTNAEAGAPLSVGDQDQFQIQIALADSGFPHEIDTSDWSTFIDYGTHEGVIAYGEIHGSDDMADWSEVVIPLEYRSTERKPTHIIVVASASRYGDYFTGSTGSVMWIDDVELVYDGNIVLQDQ